VCVYAASSKIILLPDTYFYVLRIIYALIKRCIYNFIQTRSINLSLNFKKKMHMDTDQMGRKYSNHTSSALFLPPPRPYLNHT